ncbi:MAG: T9SS type A sorting domain-containing protein [Chitinophagales bacterium]|nr:T9SS type A sorting domain-containing protein [Chitinophagales bacterium]
MQWLKEDRGVECDPHTHEATYNYADVAYLMQQLGVTPTNTMSGFLYNQLQNGHSWEDYQDGVLGDSFPTFHWYPEILGGAATPNHLDDPEYYGVYKPKSMAEFTVHEPTNHLILCGTGCKLKISDTSTVAYIFSQIKRITDAIQDGTVPANGIYTQEIMFSESDADQIFFLPFVTSLIDSINVLVTDEKVEWRNIASVIDYWKNDFNSQPFAMDCNFTVLLEPSAVTEINSQEGFEIFPNTADEQLQITVSDLLFGNEIKITNINGQLMMKEKIISNKIEIPVSSFSDGIYFISVANSVKKFFEAMSI